MRFFVCWYSGEKQVLEFFLLNKPQPKTYPERKYPAPRQELNIPHLRGVSIATNQLMRCVHFLSLRR